MTTLPDHSPWSLSRREWSQLSAAGLAGVSFPGWLRTLAAQTNEAGPQRHKSCILLWMDGGPSQVETFDPKPEASDRVRGELQTIAQTAQ